MGVVDWLSPLLSFVGGGLGAALGYRSAAASDRQADRQSRREEWGRRFTTALVGFTSGDPRERKLGRTMMEQLVDSELASADDRRLVYRMLMTDAGGSPMFGRIVSATDDPRDLDFVESPGIPEGGRTMSRIVRVTHDQVESARALVRLSDRDGIPVDPIIARIARARPEEWGDRPDATSQAAAAT